MAQKLVGLEFLRKNEIKNKKCRVRKQVRRVKG